MKSFKESAAVYPRATFWYYLKFLENFPVCHNQLCIFIFIFIIIVNLEEKVFSSCKTN